MDSIIMAVFPVESEAYQAFSELKHDPAGAEYLVSQAVLVQKDGTYLKTCETFDTGLQSADDTVRGSLIGACVGVLGGPVGMLLGMSIGGLTGAVVDTDDVVRNASLLETIAAKLTDQTAAILALTQEEIAAAVDAKFAKFNAVVTRYDAAAVQEEIEAAEKTQRELAKQARAALRAERGVECKARVEQLRQKIKQDFEALKGKFAK